MNEDQWEYVCGAGNSSIFRWGNFYPNDRDTRYNFWGIDMCQKIQTVKLYIPHFLPKEVMEVEYKQNYWNMN